MTMSWSRDRTEGEERKGMGRRENQFTENERMNKAINN